MHRVLLLGAGKIGSAIARLLARTGDFDVLVGDVDESALARLGSEKNLSTGRIDSSSSSDLDGATQGRQSVLSALNYSFNPGVARAALSAGASYFDLTEDVQTMYAVKELAGQAREGQIFMPQCGLAPGFVSIAANHLVRQFEKLQEVEMRVGALPIFPTNEMKYNLTWSTDGLINEYGNPCEAIVDGKLIEVLPLEGLEHFSLDGVDYEAFNTSGGVGTLCDTLAGTVRNLNYKTVRYRGHRDLMFFLMNELRLNDRRAVLKDILESAVPMTPQDVVLIFVTVTGIKDGRLTQITDARKIYHAQIDGEPWSAIQITTAAGICAALDLHATDGRFGRGFVRQEQIPLDQFRANRFGRYYANGPQQESQQKASTVASAC
jgi:saccharopine dehydrogenase-like NADP-dependent oxidoreductase